MIRDIAAAHLRERGADEEEQLGPAFGTSNGLVKERNFTPRLETSPTIVTKSVTDWPWRFVGDAFDKHVTRTPVDHGKAWGWFRSAWSIAISRRAREGKPARRMKAAAPFDGLGQIRNDCFWHPNH